VSRTAVYLVGAVCLVVAGAASLPSFGVPLALTGLILLACYPWRRRLDVIAPALAAVWSFTLAYLFAAPLTCTTSATARGGRVSGRTVCHGALFDYSGGRGYNPPLLPAVVIGLAAACACGLVIYVLVRRRALRSSARS
jgi:hypothetical protein